MKKKTNAATFAQHPGSVYCKQRTVKKKKQEHALELLILGGTLRGFCKDDELPYSGAAMNWNIDAIELRKKGIRHIPHDGHSKNSNR